MSRSEKFFNPKALVRIARAVEWPGLEVYKDGSTTQGRYMEAIAVLYRNWFLGYSLDDAVEVAKAAIARDWSAGFRHVVEEIPSKIAQVVGFWSGLRGKYAGARARASSLPRAYTGGPVLDSSTIEREVWIACDYLIAQLRIELPQED